MRRRYLTAPHEFHLVGHYLSRSVSAFITGVSEMPQNCSVPRCRTRPGNSRGFYKFPLHEPERLHLWLRNMGQDDWKPSRHQHICHKHFSPSNFKIRGGVRHLKNTAVPTLFKKEKLFGESESRVKWRWTKNNQSRKTPGPVTEDFQVESKRSNLSDLGPRPVTLHTIDDFSIVGDAKEMVLIPVNQEDAHGLTAAVVTDVHREDMEDITCTLVDLANIYEVVQTVGDAYFMPHLFPSPAPQLTFIPETVLSSALSPQPITSTVPIVSKYSQSSKVVKIPDSEEEEEDVRLNTCSVEHRQQVEHCYYKNSVSKEQLETAVVELQRKVKVLQQRHRRHVDKLEGLEKTVGRLRQNKLLYEERLQRLERAYLQANVNIADPDEMVTIIYEEESPIYFCTNVPKEKF